MCDFPFARCCTSVLNLHSKNIQITFKLLTQGNRYHKHWKTFGKFFRLYSDILSKFDEISFQEYVSEGIFYPVYKLRRSNAKRISSRRARKYLNAFDVERMAL